MGYKEMSLAYQAAGLTDGETLVLIAVAYHANVRHGDTTFVGQETLGNEIGKPRTSVNKALRALEKHGYISRTSRPNKSRTGRGTDLLTVHYDVIERAIRDADRVPAEGTSVAEQRSPAKGKRADLEQFQNGTVLDREGKRADSEGGNVPNWNEKGAESAHVTGKGTGKRTSTSTGLRPGAPPPALESASNSPRPDADGNTQDWGVSGSASYDWGTQDDTQPNPSGQDWEPAKDTAPEPADPPVPAVPSHDASHSDQIGTGRRALQELLAQRRTNITQEATP